MDQTRILISYDFGKQEDTLYEEMKVMNNIFNFSAVVILYHPDSKVLENIGSYITYCNRLYVVDNSGGDDIIKQLIQKYGQDKIEPIFFDDNKGIAYPLNIVLQKCVDAGFHYLMTMDQDTKFIGNGMINYYQQASRHNWTDTLSISAVIFTNQKKVYQTGPGIDEKFAHILASRVITSTNIIDVNRAREIGGYNEDLFIDEVDYEFCYRGKLNGYNSYSIKDIDVLISLGKPSVKRKFLWKRGFSFGYDPIRIYYITRNRLWVYKHYRNKNVGVDFKDYIADLYEIFKRLIFYDENGLRKVLYMLWGIKDFLLGKMRKVN